MIYPAPRSGREPTPHWKAAREGRLSLPFDVAGNPVWPPRDGTLEWRDCSPDGHILGFSIIRRPLTPEWKERAPYCVAIVMLKSGHRLFSNVVDCDVNAICPGMLVTASFVETTDPDLGLVLFRPKLLVQPADQRLFRPA